MGHQETVNFCVMLVVSVLMAMEALAAWRRLRYAGGRALSLALMVGALESLCYALVFLLGKGPGMVHLAAIYAVTGPLLGAFWLIFAVRFAGTRLPHGRWLEMILVGAGVGLVVVVAANPSLIFPSSEGLTALMVDRTGSALFSIQLIWFSTLVAAGIVLLLLEALRSWHLYRTQVLALIGGVGSVFALDIAFTAGFQPVRGLHLGLAVFAAGMLPLIWALPRLRTVDLSAVWQSRILDEMSDAVLVVDGGGRIVDANRSAQRLLAAEAPGSSAAKTLAERPWLAELVVGEAGELDTLRPESIGEDQGRIVTVEVDAHTHHFDLRQSALRDRQGRELSRVLVLRDLTERIETAKALDEANDDLRALVDAGLEFGASLKIEDVLGAVARRMRELAGADECDLYRFEDGRMLALLTAEADVVTEDCADLTFKVADSPLTEEALRTRKPVCVYDAAEDPRLSEAERSDAARFGYRSSVHLPLIAGGRVVGLAMLTDARPRTFEHLELLQGLAHNAAQTLVNARMYAELGEKAEYLALVSEAGSFFSSTLSVDEVLLSTCQRLCEMADAPICSVYVVDGASLRCRASVYDGEVDKAWMAQSFDLEQWSSTRIALETRTPVMIESLDDPRLGDEQRTSMRERGEVSLMAVPLVARGEAFGTVELVDRRSRTCTKDEMRTLEAVCSAAALAIRNADMFAREHQNATRLASVLDASHAITSTVVLDNVLPIVAEKTCIAVASEECTIWEYRKDEGVLAERTYYSSRQRSYAPTDTADLEKDPVRRAILEGGVIVEETISDEHLHPLSRALMQEWGEKSRLSAPLVFDGEPIGMLVLIETERVRHFKPEELELVQALAEQAAVAIQNARQFEDVRRMHANNLRTLCTALNAKDYYTLGHTARVAAYMNLLGKELGWSSEAVHRIGEAAYLHDIGKIGIPDRILTKAGKLNQREWELMRQHPVLSADIIGPLYGDDVVLGVRHHHERYDGRGYPDGLAGAEIPLIARAMCVVDSYDAMSFDRPYHRGFSFTDCLAELERCKGSQFDPVMVDAFAQVLADITSVRQRGLAIGAQAAALIDVDAHVALVESGSEDDPAYSETVRILCAVRDANPGVRYVTTVARRGAGQMVVCDAEEDEEERSHLGEAVGTDVELPRVLAGETPDICLASADQYGVWISAVTPLTRPDGEIVGAVSVDFPAYEAADEDGLRGDATQILTRLLVGDSERVSRAEADAATDLLSGLYTHGRLHEGLAEQISCAEEAGGEVSLVLCDVDRFADFNRLVGHAHGDEALRLIGQLIESASGPTDLCARFGGDEFAVVLNDGGARALEAAEALREAVEAAKIDAGGRSLTLSVGVATFPWDGQTKDALIDRARWAVDLAKRRGRNRCVRFEDHGNGSFSSSRKQALRYLAMMAKLTDARVHYEEKHSETVARLAAAVAVELGMSRQEIADVGEAARLRDIGQFGIPDNVLSKPGALSDEEWVLIREHPRVGERLLRHMGFDSVADAVAHHHERFDGTGYPLALSGQEIPRSARIVAVASTFQALVNRRPYRPERSADDALEEMRRCAGTQFDPEMVAALERVVSHS